MELYVIIVGLLLILAVADLVVGVSNDAVNFLNSAIGSQVASMRVILGVASVGILLGASFSGGMMEVARSGIFHPDQFVFAEVMVIFLAVMLTDIILLDAFNTLGLPTSTTVSIVFELLGAAVAVALVKMAQNPDAASDLAVYINQSKVSEIIIGIFLSVLIAFSSGSVVQYVARALFTFENKHHFSLLGAIWSGLSLTAITWFLLIKGLKGSTLVPGPIQDLTHDNPLLLLILAFTLLTALSWMLQRGRVNVLRVVVLVGTFALAMAFAGNDLVNFIGVPLAGFESYRAWAGSNLAPEAFSMEILAEKYPAQSYLLFLAGLIMMVTLWTSRKARSVTETEVNLGRQAEGNERFHSNLISRSIVRVVARSARLSEVALPITWRQYISSRFERGKVARVSAQLEGPSFDLVRASVNLTVASILIAIATSYKLPLSTTYVTFMVAMGTSLSDRAWGRDSAVYRVAGVLQVIGGWFVTAMVAFVVSGLAALLIVHFHTPAIAVLTLLAFFALVFSFRYHKKQNQRKQSVETARMVAENGSARELITQVRGNTAETLQQVSRIYRLAVEGVSREDQTTLRQASRGIRELSSLRHDFRQTTYTAIRKLREEKSEGSRALVLNSDLEKDMLQCCGLVVDLSGRHVADVLMPLLPEQQEALREVEDSLSALLESCAEVLRSGQFGQRKALRQRKRELMRRIEDLLGEQASGIQSQRYSSRNSMLFFNLLMESKDMAAVAFRFIKLHHRLENALNSGQSEHLLAETRPGEED